jgi:hypothetical protein
MLMSWSWVNMGGGNKTSMPRRQSLDTNITASKPQTKTSQPCSFITKHHSLTASSQKTTTIITRLWHLSSSWLRHSSSSPEASGNQHYSQGFGEEARHMNGKWKMGKWRNAHECKPSTPQNKTSLEKCIAGQT